MTSAQFQRQRQRRLVMAFCLISLSGCFPMVVAIHDGIEATVIDAETKEPLAGVFAYDEISDGKPRIRAQSDAAGRIQLDSLSTLSLEPLLGESPFAQTLWLCKDGYKPLLVSRRPGWNAHRNPVAYHKLGTVELTRSSVNASCLDLPRNAKW